MNKKNKFFFIAIDTKNIQLAKNIIKLTNTRKIKKLKLSQSLGYSFFIVKRKDFLQKFKKDFWLDLKFVMFQIQLYLPLTR